MFNPDSRVHLVPIPGQLPCIVVDDFLLDPDALVAEALRCRAGFAPAPHNAFPGMEQRMHPEFSARLDEYFTQHIRSRLGARRTSQMFSRLSMVSLPPSQLRPLQRVCHHDNYASAANQCFPAAVLYLFKDADLGGTSFYQPKQSFAETHALFDAWGAMSDEEFTRLIKAEPAYLTDSNDYFELVATVPAAYNRAIFYEGSIFHSSHITRPELLTTDPATGRLTLNAFWICRKSAGARAAYDVLMDSKLKKQSEALSALSDADRVRLEYLAKLAGVTAEQLWPDVWQFGFDDTEDSILADIDANADIAAGRTIPNEEVMAKMQRILQGHHERPKRKAS